MHGEKRFADFVVELSLVARCVVQIENILSNALVEILKTGNNMLDVIPNPIVIGNKSFPINRAAIIECRASKTGDNRRLTAQLIARRLEHAVRRINDPHRVLDCDKLLSHRLSIDFRTAKTWKN